MSETDENTETDGGAVIELPVVCDLAESEALLDRISDVGQDVTIVLDASGVEQMSTPCVFAIVSAMAHREQTQPAAAVINPTPPFMEAFQDLGLYREMMKMEFRT